MVSYKHLSNKDTKSSGPKPTHHNKSAQTHSSTTQIGLIDHIIQNPSSQSLTTAVVMQLQRLFGNQKTLELISASSSTNAIQRAKREDLIVEQVVYFPTMTVVHNWWIEPDTKGIVRKVSETGDIEVEITTGQYSGNTVKVGPSSIETLISKDTGIVELEADIDEEDVLEAAIVEDEFVPNERKIGEWGSIWEVRPSIGVEIPNGQDSYLDFIIEQLNIIGATTVGKAMIARFSENESFRKVEDQSGPYTGLTLIIGQPPERKKNRFKGTYNDSSRVIKTGSSGGRNERGGKTFGDSRIPEIVLHNRPEVGDIDYVDDPEKGVEVTPTGIAGHKDFYDTQPYDVILYHEMVHSLVSQLGVSSRLAEIDTQIDLGYIIPQGIAADDHVEEQLVVGIMGGLGLSFSENAYREEKEYDPRKTYKSVGIEEDSTSKGQLKESDMDKLDEDTVRQEIYRALRKAGLSEVQALYAVGKGPKPG